jgi:ParB family chromosome partitioning protein
MVSNSARPAAGDGGSRQCIGSQQNLTAETKATPEATQAVLPIDQIIVGDRTRRNLGDIAGLATSIAEIGLLHPITVDENGRLLAGARGLAACKRLGLETVEVKIVRCGDGSVP